MSEQITVSGRQVEVKGLTMKQIKEVMANLKGQNEKQEAHVIDAVFDDDVPAFAVSLATGLSLAELEGDIGQQDMRDLLDKVKAVNPFFVGMMTRLISLGTQNAPLSTESVS